MRAGTEGEDTSKKQNETNYRETRELCESEWDYVGKTENKINRK